VAGNSDALPNPNQPMTIEDERKHGRNREIMRPVFSLFEALMMRPVLRVHQFKELAHVYGTHNYQIGLTTCSGLFQIDEGRLGQA
jgi:hypothetical protein